MGLEVIYYPDGTTATAQRPDPPRDKGNEDFKASCRARAVRLFGLGRSDEAQQLLTKIGE